MRSENEVNRAVEKYADLLQRICFYHLKNRADTEDVFQTVFMKYMLYDTPFRDEEHEKAWLIRVSVNACKDLLKSFFRRSIVSMDTLADMPAELPDDHLHYYEGYSAAEIGRIVGKKENSIYSLLSRGRGMLKEKLGGDGLGE